MRLTLAGQLTAADAGRRTITGRIVTFGEVGRTSAGRAVFEPGSISFGPVASVRLVLEHDTERPLGRAVELTEHADGIDGTFRIVASRAGDDALVEAAERLRDGLSVGVDVVDYTTDPDGTIRVALSDLDHVGLVTRPAISSARVDRVAASQSAPAATEGDTTMDLDNIAGALADDSIPAAAFVAADQLEQRGPVTVTASATSTRPRYKPFETAADYVLCAAQAGAGDHDARMRLQAAAGDVVVGDVPGIVPVPITGDVISTINDERPVIESSRKLPMPKVGKTFERPFITTHSSVAAQSTELTALSATTMQIDPITVTKATYGGQLNISFQNRDWTDPAILNIAIEDLGMVYARQTENAVADALLAASTGEQALAANAAVDVFLAALYSAAGTVKAGCGKLPDTLYASVDQWVRMGSFTDTTKRPYFPSLSPSNAAGTMAGAGSFEGNPLGLKLVVSGDFADGTLIMGRSSFLETYEDGPVGLSVVNPSTLGFVVARYGYLAHKVTVGDAFVVLAPSP